MKLYTLEEFLKLPEGTFYTPSENYEWGRIYRKGKSTDYGHWYTMEMKPDFNQHKEIKELFLENWSGELMLSEYRDCALDESFFLVWEKEDMIVLRDLLNKSIEADEI